MAPRCIEFLIAEAENGSAAGAFIGLNGGRIQIFSLEDLPRMADAAHLRPKEQWWLDLRPIARLLCQPGENTTARHSAEMLEDRLSEVG